MKKNRLFYCVIPALLIAGCGKKSNSGSEQTGYIERDSASEQTEMPDDQNEKEPEYTVTHYSSVNDGYSWVSFTDDNGAEYTGLMDRNNTLLFYIEGFAYYGNVVDGKYFYFDQELIDFNGKKVTFENAEYGVDPFIFASGDGYTLLDYHVSNFDEDYHAYELVDVNGNDAVDLSLYNNNRREHGVTNEILKAGYMGNGLFYITTAFEGTAALFYTKSKGIYPELLVGCPSEQDPERYTYYSYSATESYLRDNNRNDNGRYLIHKGTSSDNESDYITFFDMAEPARQSFMSYYDKYIYDISIPENIADGFTPLNVSGDYLFWKIDGSCYGILDIKTGQFRKYAGKYADRVYWENSYNLKQYEDMHEGIMAIPVQGADGNQYIALINSDMTEICEPFLGSCFGFLGDYLLTDKGLYDLQGNLVNANLSYELHAMSIDKKISENKIGTIISYQSNYEPHYEGYQMLDGSAVDWDIDYSSAQKILIR